jgi:Flp pilus assembly pilin Flp
MKSVFKRLVRDESGATAVEYAILSGLVLASILTVIPTFAGKYEAFTLSVGGIIGAALP